MDTFNAPPISLPKNIQKILTQFSAEIVAWKEFLKGLGFNAIAVTDETDNVSVDEGFIYPRNSDERGPIWGRTTRNEAIDDGMIICGAGFACAIQFMTGKHWTDETSDLPYYIEFGFGINDKAFMQLEGFEGTLLFDPNKYFPIKGKRIEGTHKEIIQKLLSLAKEMAENLRLGELPKQEA